MAEFHAVNLINSFPYYLASTLELPLPREVRVRTPMSGNSEHPVGQCGGTKHLLRLHSFKFKWPPVASGFHTAQCPTLVTAAPQGQRARRSPGPSSDRDSEEAQGQPLVTPDAVTDWCVSDRPRFFPFPQPPP